MRKHIDVKRIIFRRTHILDLGKDVMLCYDLIPWRTPVIYVEMISKYWSFTSAFPFAAKIMKLDVKLLILEI